MTNEILLILSIIAANFLLVFMFRFFGKTGVCVWTVICSIASNIEVLILIEAFGLETTLGNVLFASSFLATDILSETYGKKQASLCVTLGLVSSVIFILISQSWLFFVPSSNDTMAPVIRTVFSRTPRVMAASLVTYFVCQLYDVWSYHVIWDRTTRRTGDRTKGLWIRNNVSTLVSQLINVVLFNLLAFGGIFSSETMTSVIIFSYLFYILTSLMDTPFIYLARKLAPKVREVE